MNESNELFGLRKIPSEFNLIDSSPSSEVSIVPSGHLSEISDMEFEDLVQFVESDAPDSSVHEVFGVTSFGSSLSIADHSVKL